jgi:hypothetical protein
MQDNKLHPAQIEELDNSVPIFNPAIGDFQYENGTRFECQILSWKKISKETQFKISDTEDDTEES